LLIFLPEATGRQKERKEKKGLLTAAGFSVALGIGGKKEEKPILVIKQLRTAGSLVIFAARAREKEREVFCGMNDD